MAVAPGPTGLGAVQAPMPLVFRQPEAALLDCSGQLMSDLSSVTQQIERAFADVDYPGDWCLVNSLEGDRVRVAMLVDPGLLRLAGRSEDNVVVAELVSIGIEIDVVVVQAKWHVMFGA